MGAVCCVVGTAAMSVGFWLMIRVAEKWSNAHLLKDDFAGLWASSSNAIASSVGGLMFAWFWFGFFITYSRLSSRAELHDK